MTLKAQIDCVRPIGHMAATAALLASTSLVQAAGFYLQELGTPHSLGTAGVANPTNIEAADSALSNPAGMVYLDQDAIIVGTQVIAPKIEFDPDIGTAGGDDGGNAGNTAVIPSAFYVQKYSDKISLGLSVAATMGGGVDYGSDFVGRYSTVKAELGAIAMAPSIAYKVNDKFSIGGGVSLIYTTFEQEIAINTAGAGDGRLKIEDADDIGFQPFFSMNYRPNDRLLLSLVYRAEMDVDLSGDVDVRNVAVPIGADSVDIDWDNPQWVELGLRYELTNQDTLYLSAGWQDWSAFSNNRLAFSGGGAGINPVAELDRNFKDTYHAGIAYVHRTGNGSGYSVGAAYDSSPVDDDDRTFDLPFDELFKVGASYFWQGDRNLDFSVGGTLIMFGDGAIDQTSGVGPLAVRAKGEFDDNYLLFVGGTLRYVF
jgi:long-chain fatty acid transport protein